MQAPAALRLFLALDLPPQLRAELGAWRAARRLPGRAERLPNLHMTLVFLGDTPAERVPLVCAAAAATAFPPFELRLNTLRRWGNGILHLAPRAPPPPLLALQAQLAARLAALGFPPERRRFSPHLTLARDAPFVQRLGRCRAFVWPVDTLTLFSSERAADGSVCYRVLHEWPAAVPEGGSEGRAEGGAERAGEGANRDAPAGALDASSTNALDAHSAGGQSAGGHSADALDGRSADALDAHSADTLPVGDSAGERTTAPGAGASKSLTESATVAVE